MAGAALLGVLPALAEAGPVSGEVRTVGRPGVAAAPAVVYAERIDAPVPRRAGRFTLTQKGKTFHPRVLIVPVGSTVEFPNDDLIFHNVFSLSGVEPFDLGLYRAGESRSRTFTQAATYRVFCNIHPQMSAFIVVAPTPHAVPVDRSGRFVLDLPPGRYRITALSERALPVSVEVASGAGAGTAPPITLDESQWVDVAHQNKHGMDYPASAYKR